MNFNERFNSLNKLFVKEEYFTKMINTYATNVKVNDLAKKVEKCALTDTMNKISKGVDTKIESLYRKM